MRWTTLATLALVIAAVRADSIGPRIAAQWHADRRSRRPKTAKLAAGERLRAYVQQRPSGAVQRPDGGAVADPDGSRCCCTCRR